MDTSEEIRVLVTGVGGGGHGEQIVKALRLGKRRYRIIGTDVDESSSGFALVDEAYRVPRAADPTYLETILGLCRQHRVCALFHGSEQEMMVFARNRALIEAEGIYLPVNQLHVMEICQDKVQTMRFLREHGFSAPESRRVNTLAEAKEAVRFPVVLKPAVGGGGSANVFIAQDTVELETFVSYLLTVSPSILMQDYVGTPASEFTVGVLFGADGVLLNSIGIRRFIGNALSVRLRVPNRTGRAELSTALVISSGVSQGEVGRWPEVTTQCEKIAAALRPNAPINIQCRLVDGVVLPFEINPRFSGTTSLRAMAGYNEPDILIRRDVLGEDISKHFGYDSCVIMRGLHEERIVGSPDLFVAQT